MVRRINPRKAVNNPNMLHAVVAVKDGMMYCAAALKHNVSPSTLHLRVNGPATSLSRRVALTQKEEERLVSFVVTFARREVLLTQAHVSEGLANMVTRMDPTRRMLLPFRRGIPGQGHLSGFLRRHNGKFAF